MKVKAFPPSRLEDLLKTSSCTRMGLEGLAFSLGLPQAKATGKEVVAPMGPGSSVGLLLMARRSERCQRRPLPLRQSSENIMGDIRT